MLANSKRLLPILSLSVLLVVTSTAVADISNVVFRIEATNAAGSGSFEVTKDKLKFNPQTGTYTWNLPAPITLTGVGGPVAVLDGADLTLKSDPQVSLGFAVLSGMTTTTFIIESALLSFPPIPAGVAEGRASAALSVTDLDNNGATLQGLGAPGTGVYLAQYNGFVPNGTTFASLLYRVFASPGGSGGGSQNYPQSGYLSIPNDVKDMSAQLAFTLTANDSGSGTSNFEIIPEPASLILFGFGALLLAGRRR
jgi:hypothetical protein